MRQTIYITKPVYLKLQHGNLILQEPENGITKHYSLDDMAYLLLDHPQITITHPVLSALSEKNVILVSCDKTHYPTALFLPLHAHHAPNKHLRAQLNASLPLEKQLWRKTIQAKLKNQAQILQKIKSSKIAQKLKEMGKKVVSGDRRGLEATAARIYWKTLFGRSFIRDRMGETPNQLLNYGYIVLRSAMARAIVGSGLLPAKGIHHHHRNNSLPLADDMMEPYRPFIDQVVYDLVTKKKEKELTKKVRTQLIASIHNLCIWKKKQYQISFLLGQTSASLAVAFLEKDANLLQFPNVI